MLQRVMPDLMGMKNILVLNDEAHHCYREKPQRCRRRRPEGRRKEGSREEQRGRPALDLRPGSREPQARAWPASSIFRQRRSSSAARAMPKGTLFPWTMSDFSLMDAIECGIVKLPRVPVADNIPGDEMPMYRNLWEHIRKKMPKKGRGKAETLDPLKPADRSCKPPWKPSTATTKRRSSSGKRPASECRPASSSSATTRPPPSWSTTIISGFHRENEDGIDDARERPPRAVPQFRRDTATRSPRPNTLLIDSEQLESGEALDDNFREHGGRRDRPLPPRDHRAHRRRHAQAENITDQELLREVMNTVGKPGQLGGSIRCVVSVSMLTEGWDANTVTHVLGVRAFGTQLLCEQVIGRALRRQSYDLNEEGLFNVEYADVLGIPFDFTAKPVVAPPQPPRETIQVKAVRPDRDALEIRFPRVEGYRVELPDGAADGRVQRRFRFWSSRPTSSAPSITQNSGIIGEERRSQSRAHSATCGPPRCSTT